MFSTLRVEAKGRFLVHLACIAALLLSGMVAHVTLVLAADSQAAAAVDTAAMKQPAIDHDAHSAAIEDPATLFRFQRHHEKRAPGENEEDDDKSEPVDPRCLCKTTGTICGSTFDMTCGYVSDAVFNCEEVDEEPVLEERCPSKFCKSGEKECGILGQCMCKGPGQICGSTFDTSCDLNATSLYYCSGVGDTPSEIESCKSDSKSKSTEVCPRDATGCASKDAPIDPTDPCVCTQANSTVCFSTFPASCGYKTDGVYSCVTVGKHPVLVETCSPSKCIPVIGDGLGRCDKDPCLCSYTNDRLCGTDFPEECGYLAAAIYTCPKQPARPQLVSECPEDNKCANTERGPTCQP
ncbi:hypothetical protein BGZ67_000416 [Mortierella alpina]|nr:hypothetical protein BGZ67_000416 [Mortierella alpina]